MEVYFDYGDGQIDHITFIKSLSSTVKIDGFILWKLVFQ